jgi:regulator of replication initiation timing
MARRRSTDDTVSKLLRETQDMVGKLVQENRSLRAQNLKLARRAEQLAAAWDQVKKLTRSAPRARGRGRS